MKTKNLILFGNAVMYISMLLICLYYIVKIIELQFFTEGYSETASSKRSEAAKETSNQASILSYDHKFLSVYVPEYRIGIDYMAGFIGKSREIKRDSSLIKDFELIAKVLAKHTKSKSAKKYYLEMANHRTAAEKEAKAGKKTYNKYFDGTVNIDMRDSIMAFRNVKRVRSTTRKAIIEEEKGRRENPYDNLAHRTIIGIENISDEFLKNYSDEPDIVTSIDADIQEIADIMLRKTLSNDRFEAGTIAVMEVATGDVKAMVNLSRERGVYMDRNLESLKKTDPGSTFKIASLMAALETGKVDIDTEIDCDEGCVKETDKKTGMVKKKWNGVSEIDNKNYGKLKLQRIIEKSLNIGTAKAVDLAFRGREKEFINALKKLHVADTFDIGLNERATPFLKEVGAKSSQHGGRWTSNSMYMIATGYEVDVTPLNILCFYNAVANNGIMVKPRLIRGLRYKTGEEESFEPEIIDKSICSQATLEKVKKVMSGVVSLAGTASRISGTEYGIAGKTGTAQQLSGGGYIRRHRASFCGYFPENNPKYSCIVVLYSISDEDTYGGKWAAPLFKEIADRIYALHPEIRPTYKPVSYEVPESPKMKNTRGKNLAIIAEKMNIKLGADADKMTWVIAKDTAGMVKISTLKINSRTMPTVEGMGLRDAVYLLETMGMKVAIKGAGVVNRQSPAPGTPVKKGGRAVLELV
ncbi:MAG: PASTA domain-containing protein [Prevotellaceae bacterium]|jgi:cell division protein FtsI (penicillin-binding protein 3)|nr:PASTA domain-containing protein [Prevotellaceae bacterium]